MILVRYFAGARAVAGVPEEKIAAATLGELLGLISAAHGERLDHRTDCLPFLVDGLANHDRGHAAGRYHG